MVTPNPKQIHREIKSNLHRHIWNLFKPDGRKEENMSIPIRSDSHPYFLATEIENIASATRETTAKKPIPQISHIVRIRNPHVASSSTQWSVERNIASNHRDDLKPLREPAMLDAPIGEKPHPLEIEIINPYRFASRQRMRRPKAIA
jgi:hypothetical protein